MLRLLQQWLLERAPLLCYMYITCPVFTYESGSQSVLRGFQAIRYHFPGDPWIHACNGYLEIYLFLN